jgi:hypothetical protein
LSPHLLLVLVSVFVVGLATTVGQADDNLGATEGGPDHDGVPREHDRAFFEFQESHLRGEDWPEAYRHFDLIVCNPSLNQWHVAEIRRAIPGVTLLAYTDVQDAHIGMWLKSPYWRAFTAAFDSSLCIQDLTNGRTVRIYGHDPRRPESGGLPAFVMSQKAADILVAFHRDVTLQVDWDGFYLDVCSPEFPPWRKKSLLAQTSSFDIDSDGLPDRLDDIDSMYNTWRPYFTAEMRRMVGGDEILIGNANGPLVDPVLNGIALENVGTWFTVEQAREYLLDQKGVSTSPFMCAVWAIHEGTWRACVALAGEVEGVHLGETAVGRPTR